MLQFIKDDFRALTYCKIKGHTIRGEILNGLGKDDHIEVECERCHWPLIVSRDLEDPSYYLVSEV